jgi:hypothetical protein
LRIKSELLRSITEEKVQHLCDSTAVIDGSDLYAAGRVKTLTIHDKAIETEVWGKDGRSYRVIISDFDGDINCECTCSHESFEVCPHAISVLLCWINIRENMGELRKKKEDKERDEISSYLMSQPKEYLAKVIMEQADENKELLKKLGIESALGSAGNHDVKVYKRQIDEIFNVDYVGYWKALKFIQNLELLKREIDGLIDRGLYVRSKEIMLYFLEKAKAMVTKVNDSEGDYIRFVRTLYDSYTRILKGLDLKPEEAASWIYNEIKTDGYGFADELLDQMVEVLQIKGFKVLENMTWQDFVNCKNPVDKSSRYDMEKQRYKHILMNVAKLTNNDELYIKTCEQTLNHGAYEYLVLAKKLESLKRIDEAINNLNEGIDRYPNVQGINLHGMLSELYEKKGDLEKAYECAYSTLARQQGNYQRVRSLAIKLKRWHQIKPEIIDLLVKGRHFGELIELYLQDNQLPEAIEIASRDDVFTSINWKVAELAEKDRPLDAILLYRRFVDYHINLKTKTEYKEAVRTAHKIKGLYERIGQSLEWNKYLEDLKTKNKRKVNLLKILDKL